MRTTLNIHPELLAEAKVRAARQHRTIGDVVDEALREHFARDQEERGPVALPDFHYGGGINVDLYDKDALDALMRDDAVS